MAFFCQCHEKCRRERVSDAMIANVIPIFLEFSTEIDFSDRDLNVSDEANTIGSSLLPISRLNCYKFLCCVYSYLYGIITQRTTRICIQTRKKRDY